MQELTTSVKFSDQKEFVYLATPLTIRKIYAIKRVISYKE